MSPEVKGYPCCRHCEQTVKHDPLWVALKLLHTSPCRKCPQGT